MLDNITLRVVVEIILGVSAFLVAVEKIIVIFKKIDPKTKLEQEDNKINAVLANIINQLNEIEAKVKNHDKLFDNDNKHLKRHDIQIADIQHKSEEDRYYNIRSFKVIIQKLSGVGNDDDLKRVYDELDEYEHTSMKERLHDNATIEWMI